MSGCKTIAEYAVKKWMENNGFIMSEFAVSMDGNTAQITDKRGDCLTVQYNPKTRKVEEE